MLFRISCKVLLLISINFLYVSNLHAQQKTLINESYKKFILLDKNTVAKYYLIHCSEKEIKLIEQSNIVRQLDDTTFIFFVKNNNILSYFKNNSPANNNWKLSPTLLNIYSSCKNSLSQNLLISVNNVADFLKWVHQEKIPYHLTNSSNIIIVPKCDKNILDKLLLNDIIIFIGEYNIHPKDELQINTLDLSANKINLMHSNYPLYNGKSCTISVKENKPDTTDIDFAGRYISNSLAAVNTTDHATTMATMAAGAGNSYYLGKGVAWGASVTSSSSNNLLPDDDANYLQNNISVQNHSYGVGVENFYGADAAAFDVVASNNDKLLFVFSAGNSGALTSSTGNYAGIPNVANLTGSFKMAKNIITVGAVDSFKNVTIPSSKGPAYDGRIKPEMVAYGEDGSSGAAALVSGTALVLQQAYKDSNAGLLPTAALVKAILLNSCDDVGAVGIDFAAGFGNLNANKALEGMITQKYFTGTITNNGTQSFSINIPVSISKAKFTLVWNDIAANANAFKAIKNDVDLQLKNTATSQTWLPWVLNSFANADSLLQLPKRKRDSLNTVEQITIDNPVAGNYNIIINGFQITNAAQPFAVAYQFDTSNIISWSFPSTNDNIFSAQSNVIRWSSSYSNANASISYSLNNGSTWVLITNNVNTSTNYFRWQVPDTNAIALLKMTVGVQNFISKPFTISNKINLNIGFNCTDSVMLVWNKAKALNSYQVYSLANKYLQPLIVVSDTQFIFNKNISPNKIFAVAPIINNKIGLKSYATNYSTQAVNCYIESIIADLVNNDNAAINLTIGTTYLVNKIVFEKLTNTGFVTIKAINIINGVNYNATDINLQNGVNIYRTVIYLVTGKIIYSENVSVLFFSKKELFIYPNPVVQNNILTLKLKNLKPQSIRITDMIGRIVFQKEINTTAFLLKANFTKGMFILKVIDKENNTTEFLKFIVQ